MIGKTLGKLKEMLLNSRKSDFLLLSLTLVYEYAFPKEDALYLQTSALAKYCFY